MSARLNLYREPWDPDWTLAPGVILAEWFEENRIDPPAAARICRLTPAQLALVLAGELPVSEEIAWKLDAATRVPAYLWLRLESRYRADLAAGKTDTTREG